MANINTLQIGDPRLKKINTSITDFQSKQIKKVIKNLIDTMYHFDLIGIAAPQIGENYKIFITEPRKTKARPADQTDILRIYINPEIVEQSKDEVVIYEGCGSVLAGQLFGPVSRPKWIVVKAFDEKGREFRFKADGILGRVIQHEVDHLNGIEFVEKVSDNTKLLAHEHYLKQVKSVDWHRDNSKITFKELLK